MQKKLRHLTRQIIATQEEERKAISRELHDEVVQTLVGIHVELAALAEQAAASAPALRTQLARTQRLVENSVQAVHRFARGLRPAVLDDLGLISALHAHCRQLAKRKKLAIKLTAFRGVDALGGAERTVLFRVAQEALANVVRHARATQVRINLQRNGEMLRMEISDNGKSFAVEKTLRRKNNRLGLLGMRERVEMIGGSLTIESAPGSGTTVRADVPFKPADRK
jgi:signal transduction histidine kinase